MTTQDDGNKRYNLFDWRESIAKRPDMYFGSTYQHRVVYLLKYILACSYDATQWVVKVYNNHIFEIIDDGVGVSFSEQNEYHRPYIEAALTIFIGLQFDDPQSIGSADYYTVTTGECIFIEGSSATGFAFVNAVSNWLEITSRREGYKYFVRTEKSEIIEFPSCVGRARKRGNTIRFQLDLRYFGENVINFGGLVYDLREFAVYKGMKLRLENHQSPDKEFFVYSSK